MVHVASYSSNAQMWDLDSCSPIEELTEHTGSVNDIATLSDMFFSASNDHTVKVWLSCRRRC